MEKAESKPDHKGSVPVDMSDNHQIDHDLWTRQDRAHHIIAQAERVAVEGDERTRHLRLIQRCVKTLHHLLMMRYMYIKSHDPSKHLVSLSQMHTISHKEYVASLRDTFIRTIAQFLVLKLISGMLIL